MRIQVLAFVVIQATGWLIPCAIGPRSFPSPLIDTFVQ